VGHESGILVEAFQVTELSKFSFVAFELKSFKL